MEVPGLNPLQGRLPPGPIGPEATPKGVPDLILNAPAGRTAAPPPQAPAQAPFQAPAQPIIQHSVQNIMNALLEMGAHPSQQNQSIAQNLANYGHPVSNQTLQIVQNALAGLPDRSAATIEAAVVLLTQDLPVNSQTVMAIKQFMNGQPLPQQMQNLPKDVGALLQQMQGLPALPTGAAALPAGQTANAFALPPGQAGSAQGLLTGTTPGAVLALPAGQTGAALPTSVPIAPAPQTATGAALTPSPAVGATATPTANAASNTPQMQQVVPGSPSAQGAPPGVVLSTAVPTAISTAIATPQGMAQVAAQSSVVQQAAGQAQAIENRSDSVNKVSEQSTALKIQAMQTTETRQQALEAVNPAQSGKSNSQGLNVNLPMQQAYSQQEQKALEQLYLYLTAGGDFSPIEKVGPGGKAQVMSPDEGIYRMIKLLGEILQLSGHLSENMQIKDYQQLFIQHQQVIQLTGLMEQKMHEFQQLFHKAFPELAKQIQGLLHQDGLDLFSKLAQLIETNQEQLKEQLKHVAGDAEKQQLLQTLRSLLEQVGFQVDKVHSNLMAREMLTQNLPVHCIPLMVHANKEAYPAELYIQQDYDPREPKQGPDSERPLKLTLTLETHNLGRVSVDLTSLKSDLSLNLKVLTRRVKILVDERIEQLQRKIEKQGNYQVAHLTCVVEPDLETRQSMLLPAKRTVRSLQRIEGIV
ncbi:MAG: hypothetical protein IV090_03935 [Candidatus Sericytochromatia bacterium]|nr:hypothetical protein [Candidatus Sericytochromatia bacterium]